MRIAVIGAGGVGGAFGVALAKAGADVTFVARGAHLAATRTRGRLHPLCCVNRPHYSHARSRSEPGVAKPPKKLSDLNGDGPRSNLAGRPFPVCDNRKGYR